jgi:hypothetical protein
MSVLYCLKVMASSARTVEHIKEITECPICTEIYKDPRSLPCLHTYCLKCIEEWCKNKQPGERVACPLCRQEFTVPSSGVDELPKNFFIAKLLVIKELEANATKTKSCDVCMSEDEENQQSPKTADMFCVDCQLNLCKSCARLHSKMIVSRDHTTMTFDELASVDRPAIYAKFKATLCEKHKSEPVKIYCFDCKTAVCMMCYVKDHNLHKCSDVDEAAQEFRAGLTENIRTITNTLTKYDKTLGVVDSKLANFLDQVQKTETAICQRADDLWKKIDIEKQKLIAELNEIKTTREKQIKHVAQEIAQDKSSLESLKKYCDELLKKGTASEISREADNLRVRVEELAKMHNEEETMENVGYLEVAFVSSGDWSSKDSSSILGKVVKDDCDPGTSQLIRGRTGDARWLLIIAVLIIYINLYIINEIKSQTTLRGTHILVRQNVCQHM